MAETSEPTPIPTPMSQRLDDLRRRHLPIVVWTLAVLIVGVMLLGKARRFEYVGLAQALEYPIASATDGRVQTVVVDLYDSVAAGDVVAKLDDQAVRASIETAQAKLGQLRAELNAARTEVGLTVGKARANRADDMRRFELNEEQRRLDILALKVEIQSDEIEAQRLASELARKRPLLDEGLVSELEIETLDLSLERVRSRVDDNRVLLEQYETELRTARARRESFERDRPATAGQDELLAPLRAAIEVEARRMDEIELQREGLVLRSPIDGQVSGIFARRGQTVRPGEPIVTVAENSVKEIVAYLAESDGRQVQPQTKVLVASHGRPDAVAESVVVNVGHTVQPLPARLWRDPRVPDHGRAVVISSAPGLHLVPGELVDVRFVGDGR